MPREIVDPGPAPTIAVPREGINFSPLSTAFGRLASVFQERNRKLQVIDAQRQGALAGTMGPVELREGVKAKDLAFNQAANQTSVNRLEIAMRSEFADLEERHSDNPEAFTDLSNTFLESLVSEMQIQDPALASALELRARGYQRSAVHRLRNAQLNSLRDAGRASQVELGNSILLDIEQDADDLMSENPDQQADAVDSVTGHFFRLLTIWNMPDPDGTGTILSQEEIAERTISALVGIYETSIASFIRHHDNPQEVEKALKEGTLRIPALAVDEVGGALGGANIELNPKEDLPSKSFERLISLARSEQGRRDQDDRGELTKASTFAKQSFDARITELQETGDATVPFTELMALSLAGGDELKAQQLLDRVASEEAIAEAAPIIATEHIFETQQRIAAMEVKGLDAVEDKRRRDATIIANQRKTEAMLDGRGFDFAMTTEPGKEAGRAFAAGNLSEPQYREFMMGIEFSIAGNVFGFVPSIMQTNEAKDIVTRFNQLENFQEMISSMTALQQKFGTGKNLELALNDLVGAGLPPLSAVLVGMDPQSRGALLLARAIQNGASTLEKNLPEGVEPGIIDDEINSLMIQVQSALPPGNDDLINGMTAAAQLLSRGVILWDKAVSSESEGAEFAFKELVESRWLFANDVAIPVDEATEQVQAAVTPRGFAAFVELNRDNIDPALITGGPVATFDYIEELLDSGRFVPDAEDEGLEIIDLQGRPVLTRDGVKLKARFDTQLKDIGEELIIQSKVRRGGKAPRSAETIRTQREAERAKVEREELLREEARTETTPLEVITFLQSRNVDIRGKTTAELIAEAKRLRRADRPE